jgi:ferredoxin
VKSVEVGTFPQVQRAFQVTRCNQCTYAPCVSACPTQAMYRRDDGIVDFDKRICIGCKACIAACPYDAIFINPEDNSAEKCNLCAHRLEVERTSRSARRDVLPRHQPRAPGRVPAEGTLGRLGGAVLPGLAGPRGASLHADPDHLLQLRVGLRAAGLRRPRDPPGPQVRGQPRAPRLPRPQLRQGPRHDQPGHRPRPGAVPAAARRAAGRGPMGADQLGRGPGRDRRPHPESSHGGPPERDHGAHRPPGRGRLHRAGAGQLGGRRPQLAHQRVLQRRPGRVPLAAAAPRPRSRRRGHRLVGRRAARTGQVLRALTAAAIAAGSS